MSELTVVASHRRQRAADEAVLALRSQGVDARVVRDAGVFRVLVAEQYADPAAAILRAFEEENRAEPEPPPAAGRPFPWLSVGGVFVLLAAFFVVSGAREAEGTFFQVGSARASRILLGEWWRTTTALCLHADLAHLAGNVLSGVLFVGVAARRMGSGLTWLLVVAAGSLANAANALLHHARHDSVGASTGVFAAVGLLAALAATAPDHRTRRPYLAAVGAGLALLAMLGTGGDRTDLWAHFFGLLVGFALGVPTALAAGLGDRSAEAPGAWFQGATGALATVWVVGAWTLALGLG